MHQYLNQSTQDTQPTIQASIHLHLESQWPGDYVSNGEPKG